MFGASSHLAFSLFKIQIFFLCRVCFGGTKRPVVGCRSTGGSTEANGKFQNNNDGGNFKAISFHIQNYGQWVGPLIWARNSVLFFNMSISRSNMAPVCYIKTSTVLICTIWDYALDQKLKLLRGRLKQIASSLIVVVGEGGPDTPQAYRVVQIEASALWIKHGRNGIAIMLVFAAINIYQYPLFSICAKSVVLPTTMAIHVIIHSVEKESHMITPLYSWKHEEGHRETTHFCDDQLGSCKIRMYKLLSAHSLLFLEFPSFDLHCCRPGQEGREHFI